MEFQIEQSYKDGCKGWIYFKTVESKPSIETLEKIAKKAAKKDWNKINPALYFSAPEKPRPTIKVHEYKDGKKVRGGISFKTKWR